MISLLFPAFLAGLLTFLAPCTLPLVPGYLAFIAGVHVQDLQNPKTARTARRRILNNSLFYVLGFTIIFMLLGSIFGLWGTFLGQKRFLFSRMGGVLLIFFGIFCIFSQQLRIFRFMNREYHFSFIRTIPQGRSLSSMLLGATFAFGWTPCVGPILGSILLLASTSGTVITGVILLCIFSLGLGIPFVILAIAISSAQQWIFRMRRVLPFISFASGLLLIYMGSILLFDKFGVWMGYFSQWFSFIPLDRLLKYL